MPELPEVETVCRGIAPYLTGKKLANVVLNRQNLRFPFPGDMAEVLTNATIKKVHRRAKYILADLDNGFTWLTHLGMSGRFNVSNVTSYQPEKHDHVVLQTLEKVLAYNDARRFGYMDILVTVKLHQHKHLVTLGVEPLSTKFNAAYFYDYAQKRKSPIKTLLLDQHFIAGIGNIYAAEALFKAGIHPEMASCDITLTQAKKLVPAIKAVLEKAITAGGSTLKDHKQPDGKSGYFQHEFQVYGRAGAPCFTCGTPITKITQAGRSTFFCSVCQPQ